MNPSLAWGSGLYQKEEVSYIVTNIPQSVSLLWIQSQQLPQAHTAVTSPPLQCSDMSQEDRVSHWPGVTNLPLGPRGPPVCLLSAGVTHVHHTTSF